MKKTIVFLVSMALILGMFAGVCSAGDKVYRLKMQTYYSPTTYHIVKEFARQVERMSGGQLKITVFAGGELVSSSQMLQAVKSGTVDIGHGAGYYFSELKTGNIDCGLPMAWLNNTEVVVIHEKLGLTELLRKEYAKHGVYYFGPSFANTYNMLSSVPLTSIEDLKKVKIRAAGATSKLLRKLGCSTVYLPPEDIYVALSTGQVDGVIYGGALEYSMLKFYEQAKYYNTTPIINPIMETVFINQKLWDSMPDNLKAILETGILKLRWGFYTDALGEEMKIRNTIFKGKLTSFPPEDIAKITEAAVEIWDEEAKKSPECAQAVEMIKELNRMAGRLQ